MMKVYSEGGSGEMPEAVPMSSVPEEPEKPTIDEID